VLRPWRGPDAALARPWRGPGAALARPEPNACALKVAWRHASGLAHRRSPTRPRRRPVQLVRVDETVKSHAGARPRATTVEGRASQRRWASSRSRQAGAAQPRRMGQATRAKPPGPSHLGQATRALAGPRQGRGKNGRGAKGKPRCGWRKTGRFVISESCPATPGSICEVFNLAQVPNCRRLDQLRSVSLELQLREPLPSRCARAV
jgi:hypothetical protein